MIKKILVALLLIINVNTLFADDINLWKKINTK